MGESGQGGSFPRVRRSISLDSQTWKMVWDTDMRTIAMTKGETTLDH